MVDEDSDEYYCDDGNDQNFEEDQSQNSDNCMDEEPDNSYAAVEPDNCGQNTYIDDFDEHSGCNNEYEPEVDTGNYENEGIFIYNSLVNGVFFNETDGSVYSSSSHNNVGSSIIIVGDYDNGLNLNINW